MTAPLVDVDLRRLAAICERFGVARLEVFGSVDAAERIIDLVGERTAEDLQADELRREALLWNFTVLGEAGAQGVPRVV